MWRKKKFFSLFVAFILILSMLVGIVGSVDNKDKSIILVITENESRRDELKNSDIEIIDSYGVYNIVKVNQKELKMLEKNGCRTDLLKERNIVHINGYKYDIQKDLERYTVNNNDKTHEDEDGLFIVHMIGPVNPDWRNELEEDVEILNYIPNYAYLVKTGYDDLEKVKKLFFVDEIIHYDSDFKIDENIKTGMVSINFIKDLNDLPEFKDRKIKVLSRTSNKHRGKIKAQVLDRSYLQRIAERDDVYSITGFKRNELKSELQSQIVGGFWNPSDPSTPYRGQGDFGAFVNQLGYTGKNVTIGIADTGIGNGNTGDAGHNDFTERVTGGIGYEFRDIWSDGYGHGTHVAGIAAGDTYHGNNITYDGHGPYYLAQGLAYDSNLFAQKIFSDSAEWIDSTPSLYDLLEDAKRKGDVYIHSNSWGESTGDGIYDSQDSQYDRGVRDSDSQSPGNQPMIIVVSAGNNGGNGNMTIASPGNGKNVITIGATSNYMPDARDFGYTLSNCYNPYDMLPESSKGWTSDDRVKPTVVAPGEAILSTSTPELDGSKLKGLYSKDSRYEWSTGTSQSTPAGSGASAVIVEYYREKHGETPSPAMVKSLMINAARDLEIDHDGDGNIDHIPNKYEGWGMIDLAPICDPEVNVKTMDQESLLQTGQIDTFDLGYYDQEKPLKITLSWTDEEAEGGEYPALKNDLDLEVMAPNGEIYRGNAFKDGFTPSGTDAIEDFDRDGDGDDDTNVVENIFIPSDKLQPGTYSVHVIGENIPADANNDGFANQDYALTMYNAYNMSSDGIINIEKDIYSTSGIVNITVKDRDLTEETVQVNISSTTETETKKMALNKIGQGRYRGFIQLSEKDEEGKLQVSDDDEIIASYYDKDTGTGKSELKMDTAFVDGSPPNIIDKDTQSTFASRIKISTDEPCKVKIRYSKERPFNHSVSSDELKINHTIYLKDLEIDCNYSYEIICEDQVGNKLIDNNSGDFYEFKTYVVDDFVKGNLGWNNTSKWKLNAISTLNDSWVCGDGDYRTGWYEILTSPLVDLQRWDKARLSIYHRYDFEKDRDGGIVQIKDDGGWQNIRPDDGYDGLIEYGHGNQLEGDRAFTGESNYTWNKFEIDTESCCDEFRFRFIMGSDFTDTDDFGWIIDKVKLNGTISPIVNFSYEPSSPKTSDHVQFIDESYDLDGKIVNWTWNFGDGDISYKQNPTHRYTDDGKYDVELQVIDNFGVEENIRKVIHVSNEGPVANFTVNRTVIRSGELIRFEDHSHDPDGNIINWTWSFGDGNISYLENPTHRYIKDDNYLVELSIKDDDGGTAHKIATIKVENGFPRAKFNYSPSKNITTEDTIQFNDLSSDIDGSIVNWTWNFGDYEKSYLKNPEHRFTDDGIYNVSLTVMDDDGAENTTIKKIRVKNVGPRADFTYSPTEAFTNIKIDFKDQSTDIDGSIKDRKWNFGDGSKSNLKNPTHEYADDGTYDVKLIVTDDDGFTSNVTKELNIKNRPPRADFTFEHKDGDKTSKIIYFSDNSSDPDGEIVNWTWYIGEDIVYGRDIEHEFSSTGKFDVKLIITDDDGASSSIEKTVNIREKSASAKGNIIVDNISLISILSIILISAGLIIWWVYKEKMKTS